jgi:hypothetical protein
MQALGQKMSQPLWIATTFIPQRLDDYSNLKCSTRYMTIYHLDGTIILLK